MKTSKYVLIKYGDSPLLCSLRWKGDWWARNGPNELKKTGRSEYSVINNKEIVGIELNLIPFRLRDKILRKK